MTTIAIKGRILAADTQLTDDNCKLLTNKIYHLPHNEVVAIAGNVDAEFWVLRWFEQGADPLKWKDKVASEIKKISFAAIFIDRLNRRWIFDDGPDKQPLDHPFYAIGTGAKIALAGMHMGLSAVESIQLASEIDVYTNNIIDRYDISTGTLTKGKKPTPLAKAQRAKKQVS